MITNSQLPIPQTANMSLDGESFTGHTLTTTWPGPVALDARINYDWGTEGRWKPFRSEHGPRTVEENPQKTTWKSSIDQRELLGLIANPAYVKSQILGLSQLAVTADTLSILDYPSAGTNWLGMWSHIMRFIPGRDPVASLARAKTGN